MREGDGQHKKGGTALIKGREEKKISASGKKGHPKKGKGKERVKLSPGGGPGLHGGDRSSGNGEVRRNARGINQTFFRGGGGKINQNKTTRGQTNYMRGTNPLLARDSLFCREKGDVQSSNIVHTRVKKSQKHLIYFFWGKAG